MEVNIEENSTVIMVNSMGKYYERDYTGRGGGQYGAVSIGKSIPVMVVDSLGH